MSKVRRPGTLHAALNHDIGVLSYEVACEVTGLTEAHLRARTNPSTGKQISFAAVVAIGKALEASGRESETLRYHIEQLRNGGEPSALDILRRVDSMVDQVERRPESDPANFLLVTRSLALLARRITSLVALNCDRMVEVREEASGSVTPLNTHWGGRQAR